nr:carbohydrate-binding domain-containing protein [Oscillospiraceae bacterium]
NKGLSRDELFSAEDLQQSPVLTDAVYVSVSDGQDVSVDSAGVWVLSGTASELTVCVDAGETDAVQLVLDGLNIENRDLPCILVRQAGKVHITLLSDSALTVREGFRKDPEKKASAVVYSRADLTLSGEGALRISSPKNGIICRDTLRITGGGFEISAASKAVAADNAIWIADGSLRLAAGSDGLHAENGDDSRAGSVYIGGGSIAITAGDDGIHGQSLLQIDGSTLSVSADEGLEGTWVLINGGRLDIAASGDGINAGFKSDAYRPKIEINGGQLSIVMDGEDPDAIDSNEDLVITGGVIELTGSGIDWDGELSFTGGTVILDGQELDSIPNQSAHHLGS